MTLERDLVAHYGFWVRALILGWTLMVYLAFNNLATSPEGATVRNVLFAVFFAGSWLAGIGEVYIKRTVFAGNKLMRRNVWGWSSERRYDDIQELRISEGGYLDIIFKSDCKWRIWAVEAPLRDVTELILSKHPQLRRPDRN